MRKVVIMALILSAVFMAEGQKDSVKELENSNDLNNLVNTIVSWGEIGNARGLYAVMQLLTRSTRDGADFTTYEMYTVGLPRDQSYAVFSWAINQLQPQLAFPEVYIMPNGTLCSAANQCKDKSNVIFAFVSARAEPHRLLLISKDGKHKLAVKIIPDPIVGSDRGCKIEVIRATPKFEAAIIRGKGFKANETAKYTSDSAGEIRKGEMAVQTDGTFVLVLAPFVKGKRTGKDKVAFQGATCSPAVKYEWGTTD